MEIYICGVLNNQFTVHILASFIFIKTMQMSYEHCISGYTNFNENIHYFYQFAYLFTAICINYRILYVIWVSQRHFYRNQSFYNLYSVDCFTSVLAMSNELIFTRSFLYFPQLCVSFSEIVKNSPVFMRIYYCLLSYLIAIKPVIHIFIAVNRMSCVMFPVTYSQVEYAIFITCSSYISRIGLKNFE